MIQTSLPAQQSQQFRITWRLLSTAFLSRRGTPYSFSIFRDLNPFLSSTFSSWAFNSIARPDSHGDIEGEGRSVLPDGTGTNSSGTV